MHASSAVSVVVPAVIAAAGTILNAAVLARALYRSRSQEELIEDIAERIVELLDDDRPRIANRRRKAAGRD